MPPRTVSRRRVLIVDDNPAIHDDFRKVLAAPGGDARELDDLEAAMFDEAPVVADQLDFELASAFQGREAYDMVVAAVAEGRSYSIAFVDMRMPPGWDGLETIEHLWEVDPNLQIVICSAYSDHSWSELRSRLGDRDALLIVKKPFDTIEIVQCAHALTAKWELAREARLHLQHLERAVDVRTHELKAVNERLVEELEHRNQIETELRLAHRLEAIGQLAAGIAHEINTPIQFIGDSIEFLRDGTISLVEMSQEIRAALDANRASPPELTSNIEAAIARVDVGYLSEHMLPALDSIQLGVGRVAQIVRAMRELTHAASRETQGTADLNRAIQNALQVTAAAYKYVANVETDFGELPPLLCFAGELNQVLVNLIVNASHAMEDCEGNARGRLGIRTRVDAEHVVIEISDTGSGIPEANRERIFDAFFTTKVVGRGTGQGLAISRAIVVDRHHGSLTFESTIGQGTTFFIRLPMAGCLGTLAAA